MEAKTSSNVYHLQIRRYMWFEKSFTSFTYFFCWIIISAQQLLQVSPQMKLRLRYLPSNPFKQLSTLWKRIPLSLERRASGEWTQLICTELRQTGSSVCLRTMCHNHRNQLFSGLFVCTETVQTYLGFSFALKKPFDHAQISFMASISEPLGVQPWLLLTEKA